MSHDLKINFINTPLILIGFGIVVFGLVVFFIVIRHRVIPLFVLRKIIGIRMFLSWLCVMILCAGGLVGMVIAVFGNFIGVEVKSGDLTLDYCWPRMDVVLRQEDNISLKVHEVGKGVRAQIIVTTRNGIHESEGVLRTEADDALQLIASNLKSHQ